MHGLESCLLGEKLILVFVLGLDGLKRHSKVQILFEKLLLQLIHFDGVHEHLLKQNEGQALGEFPI